MPIAKFLVPVAGALAMAVTSLAALPAAADPRDARAYRAYHDGDWRRHDHRSSQPHVDRSWRWDRRAHVYVLPHGAYKRFVVQHGRRALHGPRFGHWVRKHGRPVHDPRFHHRGRRHNGWIYVDLRSGRIWR